MFSVVVVLGYPLTPVLLSPQLPFHLAGSYLHHKAHINHSNFFRASFFKPCCHLGFMLDNTFRQNTFYGVLKLSDFTNAPLCAMTRKSMPLDVCLFT